MSVERWHIELRKQFIPVSVSQNSSWSFFLGYVIWPPWVLFFLNVTIREFYLVDWVLDPITKWFSYKIIYCSIYITVLTRCIVGVREDEQLLGTGTAGLEDELAANTRLKSGDIQAHILTVVGGAAYCGLCHSGASGPGLYKKAG